MRINLKDLKSFGVIFLILFGLAIFSKSAFTETNTSKPPEINKLLSNISISSGQSYKNMTIYPLIAKNSRGEELLLLDDSIKDGTIEIKEIGSGSVNNLEFQKNSSKYPVFVMAGEIVKGAKQDRIIKNDIILEKGSKKYNIAVYCVEQGRWVKQSEKFDTAGVAGSNKLRSAVVQSKEQSAVWNEVAKKNTSMGASSATSNYRASYESSPYKEDAAGYVDHFMSLAKSDSRYVGVIIKVDNKVSNIDIFGDHKVFADLWPKLIKSYAQDAVDKTYINELPVIGKETNVLDLLKNATYNEVSNPGLGNEYSISGNNFAGNSLIYNSNVIHLALFVDANIQPVLKESNDNNIQQYQNIPDIVRPRQNR